MGPGVFQRPYLELSEGTENMSFANRDDIIAITPEWKGERFEDGRPRVPDKYLDALCQMTLEEVWKPIFVAGYENQFIAMPSLHPEFRTDGTVNRKLIGRAVTAAYIPTRPDYLGASCAIAAAQGFQGTPNQWVIDRLTDRDVLVVDMYDKIYKGTFLGGNLTTALRARTGRGGAVIWGGVRDVEQMRRVPDVQVYYRGIDPTPIREFAMLGMNTPVRLGAGREAAVCLPGDVVYGCSGGVLFILLYVLGIKMHERYLFVGEILAIVYYLAYKQHGVVALMINAFAWITYAYYFSPNTNFNYHYLALIELFVLVAFTKTVFVMNNNGSKRITNTLERGRL